MLPAIELEAVTVRYPGTPPAIALQDVTLRLYPGVTLVTGLPGAGKSTLLRVLATLLPPASGEVRYPWGRAATGAAMPAGAAAEAPWAVRGLIGYVPQQGRVAGGLTVEAALQYLAAVRAVVDHRGRARALIARWGLSDVRARSLDRVSGGQQRRWLLAQSRLNDPALWILDEPARGLDYDGIRILREELAAYADAAARGEPRYAVLVDSEGRLHDLATAVVEVAAGRVVATRPFPPAQPVSAWH